MAKTPSWLQEDFINNSSIIKQLYEGQEINNKLRGIFSQKKTGKRPWSDDELERLEKIRKNILKKLKKS